MRMLLVLILSAALYAQNAAAQPEALCSVQGRVVSAVTGAPIADVKLKLLPPGPPGAPQATRIAFVTMTDEEGNFAFAGIEPGAYTFSAERSGYIKNVYGARRSTPNGVPLTLAKGEKKTGMDLRLTPQGVITGHVVQPDGELGGDLMISAARIIYVNGKKQLSRVLTSGGMGAANNMGEFRISGLEPGRYYVIATPFPTSGTMRDLSGRAQDPFQPTFYPSALDLRDATVLEIAAGATVAGIDIHPVRSPAFAVRGRVVNRSGQDLSEFILERPASSPMSGEMAVGYILRAGAQFETGAVPRGKLALIASGTNAAGRSISTRHVIDVNETMDNLEVPILPPFSVAGRLRVENGAIPAGLKITLDLQGGMGNIRMNRSAEIAEGGTFTLPDMTADTYFISVAGLPDGYYVKSARWGKEEVFESGVSLAAKSEGPLEIVLSAKPATIRGSMAGAAAGVTVALVPQSQKRRARPEFYRSALTDSQGRFTFANLPPGEYKLFAWDDVESGAWTDPEFLKPIEAKGQLVTLREGSTEEIELKSQ
jgi:hypothetical protein